MDFVILGASAAGLNAARTFRKFDKSSAITVISLDDKIYSRCMLNLYIGGKRAIEEIDFVGEDFFNKYSIKWIKGQAVTLLNTDKKQVHIADGRIFPYDKILIATGSKSINAKYSGSGKKLTEHINVFTLRDINDAMDIKKYCLPGKKAVIIGGGLTGIGIATELLSIGVEVCIVDTAKRILSLQLDERALRPYYQELVRHGAAIKCGNMPKKALTDGKNILHSIILDTDEIIRLDFAVISAGVNANNDFAKGHALGQERGISVNTKCETEVKDVYAAGDVCTGQRKIWPLAVNQGITAAYNILGIEKHFESQDITKNSLNFYDIPTVSVGIIEPSDAICNVHIFDNGHVYKKIIERNGIILGVIFQRDISNAGVYAYLIREKIDISYIKKDIFKLDYSDFYSLTESYEFDYALK